MARCLKFMRRLNRESNRRRKFPRLKRLLALFGVFLLLPLPYSLLNPPSVHAQAQGTAGGFMELTSVFFGEGSRTFGPGQVITISGSIPFIPWCASMTLHGVKGRGEGLFDFFPVADFYVMKDDGQPLQPYSQELKDVSGTPNRITGGPEGVFVDEVVAITQPAGKLGPGRYKIVMDQCLDGRFDPFIDIVLGEPPNLGFEVTAAGALPPINYHFLKDRAKDSAETLSGTKVGALGVNVKIPGLCSLYGNLTKKLPSSGALFGFAKIALDRCADLIAEQKGIASDPPDPNYTQFAELGALTYDFTDIPHTPLERASRDLAHVLTEQAAINKALLTSIERFQGAQAASNDEFTLLQMQAASKYVDLLIGSGGALLRFYAYLEAFDLALQQDPVGLLPEAMDLHAFLPEMRQAISGLMRPLGYELRDDRVNGVDTFTPIGLQQWIYVYLGTDPFYPSLGLLGIPQIRAQNGLPPISFHHPVAKISGPYATPPGRALSLDASMSSDPDGEALTYAWDLTGSGAFSDATGSMTQFTFAQPGTRLVGVKATDPEGNSNVAYAMVRVGDVNAQDIIAMPKTRELFRVSPGGQVAQLKPGIGFIFTAQAIHVDLNKDIWVLNTNSIEHYNAEGTLLRLFTLQDVQNATGILLKSMSDFALDGRGDLIIVGAEDLGPGILDIVGYRSFPDNIAGLIKLLRMSKDGSNGRLIANVSQNYLSLLTIDGVLHEEFPLVGGFPGPNSTSLAIDPDGFIVVANVDYPLDGIPGSGGFARVHPDTGDISLVIPTELTGISGYGPLSSNNMVFGSFPFNFSPDPGPGRFVIDRNGQYVIASENNVGLNERLYRILIPLQTMDVVPPGLIVTFRNIQAFPVLPNSLGTPDMFFDEIAIDSGGDYVGAGGDFHGILGSGVFRTSPIGELSKIATVQGQFGASSPAAYVDVVPLERQVTPKDMPLDPAVHLDALSISQDACPGAATLNATVRNTGSGALQAPVRVLWLDGDPEGGGTVIGSALVPVPLAPGASAHISDSWPNPAPGTHQVFAIAMGANTVSAAFMVCVPTTFLSNPVVLSPPSGTTAVGNSYAVSATVRDAFGNGLSGIPVTFDVTNTNTASGMATTDANGTATFSYSGTKPGLDNIVATVTGATSNTVTEQWQGTINQPPTANAGPDQVLEATSPAGAAATLSAAGSTDPEGDPLSFTWTGPFGTLTGISISPTLPLGITKVMLAVNDGHGNTANASVNITVRDTRLPVVTAPAAITVPATEAGGARGGSLATLATFLAGGTATDIVDRSPTRLTPQVGGLNVDSNTLFAIGTTTPVLFKFQDASGNVGTATTNVTVVLGTPRVTGFVMAKGLDPSGAFYADVRLTNTGTGNARNLKITMINLRTLSGTGTVSYNSSLSPTLPVTVGNLDAGLSTTIRLFLGVASTVTKFSVTESGPVQDVLGTNYNYSTAQAVYP